MIGPGVANECIETKDGPVIWEDHFYPRSSTPSAAKCCPTVSTASWYSPRSQGSLPVIRYRTRDLTRLLPPTARSDAAHGQITGRSDDMLIIRGVNVFPSQIEELILKREKLSPHYVIEVYRDGHLDGLTVNRRDEARAPVRHRRREGFRGEGPATPHQVLPSASRCRVRVVEIGGIERSIGKGEAGHRQARQVSAGSRCARLCYHRPQTPAAFYRFSRHAADPETQRRHHPACRQAQARHVAE